MTTQQAWHRTNRHKAVASLHDAKFPFSLFHSFKSEMLDACLHDLQRIQRFVLTSKGCKPRSHHKASTVTVTRHQFKTSIQHSWTADTEIWRQSVHKWYTYIQSVLNAQFVCISKLLVSSIDMYKKSFYTYLYYSRHVGVLLNSHSTRDTIFVCLISNHGFEYMYACTQRR
jgi:hypothetical protein